MRLIVITSLAFMMTFFPAEVGAQVPVSPLIVAQTSVIRFMPAVPGSQRRCARGFVLD